MILLIEDDPVLGELLTQLFRRLRYPARRVGTIAEASALLRSVAMSLVVVDIELPDGSGLQLMEALHPMPWLRDVPVLFCAGDSTADIIERVLKLGITDFIRKPIPVDKMAMRIDRAMERSPVRVPSLRDVMARRRIDARGYAQLRDHVRAALAEVGEAIDAKASDADVTACVAAAVGACDELGALRTATILRELVPGKPGYEPLSLRDAVRVEGSVYEGTVEISEPRAVRLSGVAPAP